MFAPHTTQICIHREQPENLDVERAIHKVHARNFSLSFEMVTKDKLKRRAKNAQQARNKILDAWDNDSRLVALKPFFDSWNRWRNYYRPSEAGFEIAYRPTDSAALTLAERIREEVTEHGLDLDLVIAAGHKAFTNTQIPLRLTFLASNWRELYDQHAESVRVDVDEDEYRASSSDEWEAESL